MSMGKVFHIINPQPLNAKYVLSFSFLFFFPNGTLIDSGLQIVYLRCLNTVLAVYEYVSFAKSWQEKGSSSQAETWQLKNILMKDFD